MPYKYLYRSLLRITNAYESWLIWTRLQHGKVEINCENDITGSKQCNIIIVFTKCAKRSDAIAFSFIEINKKSVFHLIEINRNFKLIYFLIDYGLWALHTRYILKHSILFYSCSFIEKILFAFNFDLFTTLIIFFF